MIAAIASCNIEGSCVGSSALPKGLNRRLSRQRPLAQGNGPNRGDTLFVPDTAHGESLIEKSVLPLSNFSTVMPWGTAHGAQRDE